MEVAVVRRVAMVMVLGLSLINPIQAPAAADAGVADRDQAAIRTTVESQLAAWASPQPDGSAATGHRDAVLRARDPGAVC